MTRWVETVGILVAVLIIGWAGNRLVSLAPSPAQVIAATPSAPAFKIGSAELAALLDKIITADQVDQRSLDEIERQGKPVISAAAYYAAARFEYEHKRHDSALRYTRHALELAPEQGALHAWHAMLLVDAGQYPEAVTEAEQAAQLEPNSADVQRILGLAYYDSGKLQPAIDTWKHSLELHPNEDVKQYLAKAEREASVEVNFAETENGRFVLRYEGGKTAQTLLRDDLLRTLDRQYDVLTRDLGTAPTSPVEVIIYSEQQFFDVTQAPSWVGALNDGKLRIPLGNVIAMTPQTEAVLRHELTHSFVHAIVQHCPLWLNEGLAQLEEPKSTSAFPAELLQRLRSRQAPPMQELEKSFAGLTADQAHLAYAQSLLATEYLRSAYGMDGLRRLLMALAAGEEPEEALRSVTGGGYDDLDKSLAAYLANRSL